MNTSTSAQLAAIHEMMAAGHRSVRMERHTLLLWGLAAAFLILAVDAIFTPARFGHGWRLVVYAHAFMVIPVLLIVGIVDFRLTRRARRLRDETISFVQMQVTKVWWLLIGLIVLINVGMNFFGGGFLFYGVTLALMGLAFFINGLFSQQMLSWIGSLMILMGLALVLFQLPMALQKWSAVGVFGLGFPALALAMNKQSWQTSTLRRLVFSVLWLVVVLLPAHAAFALTQRQADPQLPAMDLQHFQQQGAAAGETRVIHLAAGTQIPLQLHFSGDVIETAANATVMLTLAQPVELAVKDGKPDGRFKLGDMAWAQNFAGIVARANKLDMSLTPEEGPRITLRARMLITR